MGFASLSRKQQRKMAKIADFMAGNKTSVLALLITT
jgi:hypothetical protein